MEVLVLLVADLEESLGSVSTLLTSVMGAGRGGWGTWEEGEVSCGGAGFRGDGCGEAEEEEDEEMNLSVGGGGAWKRWGLELLVDNGARCRGIAGGCTTGTGGESEGGGSSSGCWVVGWCTARAAAELRASATVLGRAGELRGGASDVISCFTATTAVSV